VSCIWRHILNVLQNISVNNDSSEKHLIAIKRLLVTNLLVMAVLAAGLILGLLPKLERTTQVVEKMEGRFQEFADEIQPVVESGAGKAIETIKGMDAERLSETATEKTDGLIDSAAQRARRFLEKDKDDE